MSDTNVLQRTESKKGKKVIFGSPRLGTSLVLGIEGFALFSLYYIGYNLDSFLIGFALAMGYLSIAAGQFLLGWVSDGKYTKIGRRKPYLIIFGPLLGISFIFLLLPALVLPDMSDQNSLFVWLLIWDVIFRFCYAVTTPYQAWMAEVFPASERPEVSQVQNTFNFIGNGLMALTTLLVFTDVFDKVAADPNTIPIEFLIIVLAFGLIAIILFIVIVLVMPTESRYEINTNLWENLKNTVKNKNYMKVVFMQGLSGFGWSIISTVMLTYTETVLALTGNDYLIVAICFLLSIFVFLYFWRKRIEKAGKKPTLLLIFIIAVLFLPITLLGLIDAIPALILGIIFIIGVGLILGGWYLFPYIIYADLAEDDEKTSGDLKAGIYTGFPSIILNIFQAIGVFILGIIVGLPSIVIGTSFFSMGLVIWGPICSIILLVAYFFTKWYVNLDFEWEKK
jgi:GPH family glycoside/pentoside/hexuronide:cation symporter